MQAIKARTTLTLTSIQSHTFMPICTLVRLLKMLSSRTSIQQTQLSQVFTVQIFLSKKPLFLIFTTEISKTMQEVAF